MAPLDPPGRIDAAESEPGQGGARPAADSYRRRWGLAATIEHSLVQRLARVLGIRLYGIFSRPIGPLSETDPIVPGFNLRVFKPGEKAELMAAGARPELELTARFIDAAFAKGDVCEAILCNGEIVAFSWSAYSPTHDHDGVYVEFPSNARYSYFAYTLPAFRGRHLFRLYKPARDRYSAERGCTTSVSYISVDNRPSITMSLAAGNQRIGSAAYIRKGPVFLMWRSRAVRDAGIRFFIP